VSDSCCAQSLSHGALKQLKTKYHTVIERHTELQFRIPLFNSDIFITRTTETSP